jgi:hypothetical protein
VGIFSYLKQKFQEHKEHRQAEKEIRAEAGRKFPAFHDCSFRLTPTRLRTDKAAVYRTSWKRAVVLTRIYREKGLDKEAAIHELFRTLAIRGFRTATSNRKRRATLRLNGTEAFRIRAKEIERLVPPSAPDSDHKKQPLKLTVSHQNSPRRARSRKKFAREQNGYEIQNDGTAIDKFLLGLKAYLPTMKLTLLVSGLASRPRREKRGEPWIVTCPASEPNAKPKWIKRYKVGMQFSSSHWNLRSLVMKARSLEPYSTPDYYDAFLKPIAAKIRSQLHSYVSKYDPSFEVSAGIKSNGRISAWISVNLVVVAYDAVVHCGVHLTDYPRNYVNELAEVIEEELKAKPELMISLYRDINFRDRFFRQAEQNLRKKHNVPLIGEAYVSEISLYRLVKKHYADACHEHNPTWLGRQRFDIYVPSLRIAIEYNGPQHYQAIELFGGANGLRETKRRDERKRQLALENGVTVYEWPYTRNVSESEVEQFLKEFQNLND